jgi:hypothetical protein
MKQHRKLGRLRTDVRVLRTGPREFRLLDPSTGANFELGARERYMLVLLHECDSPAELCAAFESRFGFELPERECLEFCEQLRRQGLLEGSVPQPPVSDAIPHRSSLPLQVRGEPANIFFDLMTLLFGWLIHPVWLWLVVPLFAFEVLMIAAEWQRFARELYGVRTSMHVVALFAVTYAQIVFFVNLPMALAMGTGCRKFRGRVRSFGLTWGNWILPTVSFFTDIGDSIAGMEARNRRTQIALGIAVPAAIGGLYALLWGMSTRATDAHQLLVVMIIPCTAITLYQCNPFSIYATAHWALASALDDWRLHSRAIEETKAWFWGRISPEPLTDRERRWLRAYGAVHYTLRFLANVALLGVAGYVVTRYFGAPGAAILLLLCVWWNRAYLAPLWRATGMSCQEIHDAASQLWRGSAQPTNRMPESTEA